MKKKGGGSKKEIDPNFGTCKKKLKMKFLYLPPPLNFIFKPGVMLNLFEKNFLKLFEKEWGQLAHLALFDANIQRSWASFWAAVCV